MYECKNSDLEQSNKQNIVSHWIIAFITFFLAIYDLDQQCLQRCWVWKRYQCVPNAAVWRRIRWSLLTSTVQSRRLSHFGHIAWMDNNIGARKILCALPPKGWKRLPGHPHITCLRTVQNDLKFHNLTLTEAIDMTQNRPLYRLLVMFGARHFGGASQK